MQWNEIIGHTDNINVLKALLENGRVPHALLFAGPEGIGKAAAAGVFAAGLLCTGDSPKPCGRCLSCRQMQTGNHPDFISVRPDGASIKIEQVRQLQREAALAPYYGQRRVGIIDAAEKMTLQAANSLLKTLEEPVGDTVFILISSERQQLLETIISRCRIMTYYPLPYEELYQALLRRGIDKRQAETVAHISGGRLGLALYLLSQEGQAVRRQAADIIMALPEASMQDVWEAGVSFEKLDRPQVLNIYKHMALLLRDLLVYLAVRDSRLMFNADLYEKLAAEAHNWSEPRLTDALLAVEQARQALTANSNIRLTSEALLIKLRDAAREV